MRVTKCRLSAVDLDQIERLTKRVSTEIGADILTRSVMLRALLRKGLNLAETREITGDGLSYVEPAENISFRIEAEVMKQLASLLARIREQRPNCGATLKNIQRPILRMALSQVETRASFFAFSQTVRLWLPLPSTRTRAAP